MALTHKTHKIYVLAGFMLLTSLLYIAFAFLFFLFFFISLSTKRAVRFNLDGTSVNCLNKNNKKDVASNGQKSTENHLPREKKIKPPTPMSSMEKLVLNWKELPYVL